jgi:hypothetical protein
MCEDNIGTSNDGWHNKPRLPYRATFEAAMRGDATALHTVFTRWEYHSGDNEFWQGIPWRLLSVAGDARFAAFVRSVPKAERREALRYLPDLADIAEQQAWEAFFRRHYPQTYVLYKESWPTKPSNHALQPTADRREDLLMTTLTSKFAAQLGAFTGG